MVTFGVVGAGKIAATFARDIRWVEGAQLLGVAARDADRAAHFASAHDIPKVYPNYDALWADPAIDAVYVATINSLHFAHAASALRAGKAVLCEKPLCTTPEETAALIEVARGEGVLLMEGLWSWCLPAIEEARRWLLAGTIGALRHLAIDFGVPIAFDPSGRHWDPAQAGGCLLDLGIYPVALARLFTGRVPDSVAAAGSLATTGVEQDVAALLTYGDVAARLAMSFTTTLPNRAALVGTEGWIDIPNAWSATTCCLRRGRDHEVVETFTDQRRGYGFEFQIQQFCDDFSAGLTAPSRITHVDSLAFQSDMARIRAALNVSLARY